MISYKCPFFHNIYNDFLYSTSGGKGWYYEETGNGYTEDFISWDNTYTVLDKYDVYLIYEI